MLYNRTEHSRAQLRICLFRYVFCWNLTELVIFVQFSHYCQLSTMVSVSHIYCWQIARLYFFCLSHAQGMLSKFGSKSVKASLMSSTHALISDKAHCFSQSGCALHGNFIIIKDESKNLKMKLLKEARKGFSLLYYVWNEGRLQRRMFNAVGKLCLLATLLLGYTLRVLVTSYQLPWQCTRSTKAASKFQFL